MIFHNFKTKSKLEEKLCSDILEWIKEAIETNGSAHILLSGGSTPLDLYVLLGEKNTNLENVLIGLVDERFVSIQSEFNNSSNIENALNKKSKQRIVLLPMVIDPSDSNNNLLLVNEAYKPFFERVDICILGMGEDGHTASIFPNDSFSDELLTQSEKGIYATKAPNYPNDRISCNKIMLEDSKNMVLLLVGENKKIAFQKALENKLPISHFTGVKNELNVYTSEL
jgi:6-phosphogluconolactonase